MSFSSIFAGFVFGIIGLFAFGYGKKQGSWKQMVIGIVLMVFPYLTSNSVILIFAGITLTVSLFIFRD